MVFLPLDHAFLSPPATVRRWAEAVATSVPELRVVVLETGQDPTSALAAADAAFGVLTPELLAASPRLRWLQAPAAAPPDGFYFDELVRHEVVVTNLRGVYRDNLADHVMAFVLGFARALPASLASQREHRWHRDLGPSIIDLGATTMVLVGVGAVGTAVVDRARVFGITVIGVDARPEQVDAPLDEIHPPERLPELLGRADWLVLTVPDTPETHRLVSAAELAAMRPGARLINVGRGGTVDTDALTDALAHGRLAGAALDVVDPEPLPAGHPLWDLPGVILTPHVAGYGSDTDAEREAVIVDNARRFVAGEPLRNVVDKRLRY